MSIVTNSFLVELGTEELPPKALKSLSQAFTNGIEQGLNDSGLSFAKVESFAAPRRLAVRISELQSQQADKEEILYGPPANIAFDRSEEHTSELQSRPHLVCRLLLEKKKKKQNKTTESKEH